MNNVYITYGIYLNEALMMKSHSFKVEIDSDISNSPEVEEAC